MDFSEASKRQALWTIAHNVRGSVINRGLVLAATLVVIDTLVVSHYQPGTALTLLRHTPPLALLTGVLLNLGPLILNTSILVLFVAAVVGARNPGTAITRMGTAMALWFLSSFVVDASHQLPFWWLMVAAIGSIGLSVALYQLDEDKAQVGQALALVLAFAVIGTYVPTKLWETAITRPYLPAETIDVDMHGSVDTVSGYVLGADSGWVTIMLDRDRSILQVRTDHVLARRLCLTKGDEPVVPDRHLHLDVAQPPQCQ